MKRFTVIALALAMSFSMLTACSSSEETTSGSGGESGGGSEGGSEENLGKEMWENDYENLGPEISEEPLPDSEE